MKPTDLIGILQDADALLIVPPFTGTDQPSLGLHVIQACARKAGFDVLVLYANLLFAQEIGDEFFRRLCYAPRSELIGENIFAGFAFENDSSKIVQHRHTHIRCLPECGNIDELIEMTEPLRPVASEWTDMIVQAILPFDIPVIGCNTTFEQTSASFALLNRIKYNKPETITIVGGANCEGEMAEGILSLGSGIDYVFSGESEQTFPRFLDNVRSGVLPADPVIYGSPCFDLDDLPTTDFSEYYDQMKKIFPESQIKPKGEIRLPYETSRGCWWGQKHHCKFCGLNGKVIKFRNKSSGRVIEELSVLTKRNSTNKVLMTDNIMPHDYFKTLIPGLGKALPDLDVFYETRANLDFEQVIALKKAGITAIQPGIEAFSSDLLKLMNKGITTGQNIALLRFARSANLSVGWFLLHSFPGDRDDQYELTLNLLPLLHHLHPPTSVFPVIINRFSPYFREPQAHGITKLRPTDAYTSVFPRHADLNKLAYYFEGDYPSATRSNPQLLRNLEEKVDQWQNQWKKTDISPPKLVLTPLAEDTFLLVDTRNIADTKSVQFVSRKKASAALFGARYKETDEIKWALENFLCAELDSQFVPLATTAYEVYAKLKKNHEDVLRPVSGCPK